MTVHACALERMPLLSAEGHTRGASQCFPHSFSSQEVCKQGQGIQQDVLTQAHSPTGFRRQTFDRADKRELSAHRPEWKVLFGDHTDTHTQGFNCQQRQPG